jgi:hypothetical protein
MGFTLPKKRKVDYPLARETRFRQAYKLVSSLCSVLLVIWEADMKILLVATFLSVMSSAWATPLPPPKPYELTQAHADRLATRLALRFGADLFGPLPDYGDRAALEAAVADVLAAVLPHAATIPLWVTELPAADFSESLGSLASCGVLVSRIPPNKPTDTIGIRCGEVAIQTPNGREEISRQLVYINAIHNNQARVKIWNGQQFSASTWISLTSRPRTVRR